MEIIQSYKFNIENQNSNGIPATSLYSFFENLYFNVVKNFGFTSITNPLISSTTAYKSFYCIPVTFSISLLHALLYFSPFVAKIKHAAAISDARYFRKLTSSKQISCKYCAK